MSIEIQREGRVVFAVPLPRAVFRDARLTFGARGLFAFLWDLPDGWVLRLGHLVKMGPEGRDALRARLRELEQVGAVRIEAIRAEGGRVAGKRWVLMAAERWAIEAPLAREPLPDEDFAEERVFRSSVKPIIGKTDAKVLQGVKVLQEAAVLRTHARGPADAAAVSGKEEKRSSPRRTKNGIECWYSSEDPEADAIEDSVPPEQIARAVAAIRPRPNSAGRPTSPVPAFVVAEIERLRQLKAAHAAEQERIAQQEQERQLAEQKLAVRAAKSAQAEAYFDSLSNADRGLLINQFSTYLATINDGVFQLYRKNNLDSKSVRVELFKFIDTTILSTSTEEAAV